MRKLVVCCDGTWNTADQEEGGLPCPTNVKKFHSALKDNETADPDPGQMKYYHPGVGTGDTMMDKLTGGGMGVGLSKNVMSGYRWLCDRYEADSQIYLLGFSRGAYTVRSLAGMITKCGMLNTDGKPEKQAWEEVQKVFDYYRDPKKSKSPACDHPDVKIHFLGVWDTVGALGIPDDLEILNLIDPQKKYQFHDTNLNPKVTHARHALAIDEMRYTFAPTLWTGYPSSQDVRQVWFPGVHSDVGGGYVESGLSDGALAWMIEEAKGCGLSFHDGIVDQIRPDPRGVLHNSLKGVYTRMRSQPREFPCLDKDSPKVHKSARDRYKNPPITQAPYHTCRTLPAGKSVTIPVYAREVWNRTGIYLEKGVEYKFTAAGEWLDRKIVSGPKGTKDGKFQPGEVGHVLASLVGKVEAGFQAITDNKDADFFTTKREEKWPWFALVGAVANGHKTNEKGLSKTMETFLIGEDCTFTPTASGYLYCFANDALDFYGNNRGSVSMTVSRP